MFFDVFGAPYLRICWFEGGRCSQLQSGEKQAKIIGLGFRLNEFILVEGTRAVGVKKYYINMRDGASAAVLFVSSPSQFRYRLPRRT